MHRQASARLGAWLWGALLVASCQAAQSDGGSLDSPTAAQRSQIAFIRDGNLWLMRPDGNDQTQLSGSGKCAHPGWSPDGQYLVFESGKNIWRTRPNNRAIRRLTTTKRP